MSSSASIPPPTSRNAPCPCGSGRRYKDCHGALVTPPASDRGATSATPAREPLAARLGAALRAQQDGRYDEALAGYDAALELDPDSFDALHMLGVVRFQRGEFDSAMPPLQRALALRPSDPAARFNLALVSNALARRPAEAELDRDAAHFARASLRAHDADHRDLRVVAFYLPQYHRIPENDAWWGEGFTEWTNVRRARERYQGHAQPHVPGELGYYDLTDPLVREAQAALARDHGVDAFCYYHYWFGGRRLLQAPLDAVLASGRPDFPFCVCWANESWTRRWDGREQEVLMPQRYAPGDARALIEHLVPIFCDRRYLRIDGRPLFLVYKAAELPQPQATLALWREVCRAAGAGDPYLAAVQRNALDDPTRLGFDAAVEFPPIGHAAESIVDRLPGRDAKFRGSAFSYANLAVDYLLRPRPAFRLFRGVTPMWDNTARRPDDGMILDGATPERFGAWTTHALRQTRLRHREGERLLFVNAWNEWAEGNHLEPDVRHGRGFLEALRSARGLAAQPRPQRPLWASIEADVRQVIERGPLTIERWKGPRGGNEHGADLRDPARHEAISIVMPVYNHASFIDRTLASLAAQSEPPLEVIAIDDGSSDDSAARVAAWAERAPFPVVLVRQPNAGADVALNRGIALARGGIVALMNSDDLAAPARLERLRLRLDERHDLAFSAVELIDDDDRPAVGAYAGELARRVGEMAHAPSIYHVLLRHNPAVSTGNLMFRRSLVERVGGFAAYRVCHDWDFLLAASRETDVAWVPEPLYRYRLHRDNTFAGAPLTGRLEGEAVLHDFLAGLSNHPRLTPGERVSIATFAREVGLGGFL